jgi:hypothetical protein
MIKNVAKYILEKTIKNYYKNLIIICFRQSNSTKNMIVFGINKLSIKKWQFKNHSKIVQKQILDVKYSFLFN